jgi:hypothetical protein
VRKSQAGYGKHEVLLTQKRGVGASQTVVVVEFATLLWWVRTCPNAVAGVHAGAGRGNQGKSARTTPTHNSSHLIDRIEHITLTRTGAA